MQDFILEKLYRLAASKGTAVMIVVGIITLVAAAFIPGLRVSSSHQGLIPADHPDQARYLQFMKEFGAADNLVVVVEGEPDLIKAAGEYFAAEIIKETDYVTDIFYKMDLDFFLNRAPLYAPLDSLKEALKVISSEHDQIVRITDVNSLPDILDNLSKGFGEQSEFDISPETAPKILQGIDLFFQEWLLWIDDPTHNKIDVFKRVFQTGIEAESTLKSGGYLLSRDQRLLFLFVKPTSPEDEVTYLEPFIGAIRGAIERVYVRYPNLRDKVKVGLTGMPAHTLTESKTVFEDVQRAGLISCGLVAVILLFGFGSIRKMIIGVTPLVCGMIITLALGRLLLGRLNLISSSFLAVLFGIGIDFGIYMIRRTEEELGAGHDKAEAVHIAVTKSGKGILTGGLTTGLAFLAVTWSNFVGFSELGLIAGIGILVVLTVTFLMGPPLLLRLKVEPRSYDLEKITVASTGRKRRMTLFATLTITILVTIFSVAVIPGMSVNYNALDLFPADTESTVYQLKMQEQSDFQMSFAAITSPDIEDLKQKVDKLSAAPSVSRIDSVAKMIPDNQEEKLKIIREFSNYLGDFNIRFNRDETSIERIKPVLDSLYDEFSAAQEDAFSGGQKEIVEWIENILGRIDEISDRLNGENGRAAIERTRQFERNFYENVTQMVDILHNWLNITPISEADFPREMIERFKSKKGNYVAYIFMKESMWDVEALDEFIRQIKEVDPNATGFPVTHQVYSRLAVTGLVEALIYALVIIVFFLILDFRSIRSVMLALLPLGVGIIWLQGAMVLFGQGYNLANIAGLPLLLGLGVVYGVHIVHRWQENREITAFAAAATTGKGVAFAAFTTISGLFSIVFARHNGVSSFGIVLLLGIIISLAAALIVLPTVIDLLFLKTKKEEPDEDKIEG